MATISTKQVLTLTNPVSDFGGLVSVTQDYISYETYVYNSDGTFTSTLYAGNLDTGILTEIVSSPAKLGGGIFGFGASPITGVFGGELSANGQYMLYSVDEQLFVKDLQSGAAATLIDAPIAVGASTADLFPLAISNDGQEIAYVADTTHFSFSGSTDPDFSGVVIQNVVTGGQATIPSTTLDNGELTPDGHYFYYTALTVPETTVVVDLVTNSSVNEGAEGIVSDDDSYFLYNSNGGEVYLHGSSGPDTLVSANVFGVPATGSSSFVAISGDDRHVVFSSTGTNLVSGGQTGLFVKDLDTGSVTYLGLASGIHQQVAISYDGTRITYANDTSAGVIQFVPPQLAIKHVAGDDFVNGAEGINVSVSGTSDAIGRTVVVSLPAEPGLIYTRTAVVQADGTWSTTVNVGALAQGSFDVHAIVTDDYNLTSTTDHPFIIDRTPPTNVAITSVAGDDIINAAELKHATVVGTVLDADPVGPGTVAGTVTISIDGGGSTTFASPANPALVVDSFSHDLDASGVADGEHIITLTAVDEAGNKTVVTKQILVDTTPPKIAITSVSGDDVVNSTEIKSAQGMHGTSDAIGQTVNVLVDGVQAGQAVVQADGSWISTVSFAGTVTGTHDVTAEVSDEAGNPSRADAAVYVDAGFAVTQLSVGPHGEQGGGQGVLFPGLSADGTKLVFTGLNFDLIAPANGSSGAQVYVKDLTTGAISSATPDPSANSEFGAISQDGTKIVFVSNAALDPVTQAMTGVGPGYYTYEENLADGVAHIRVFDSQSPDTYDLGVSVANPPPVYPLAIANNGYDSEMVEITTSADQSGAVDLAVLTVLDGSVDANGQPTSPYNQLGYLTPAIQPSSSPSVSYFAQEYAPQISADGSVAAFEARLFSQQYDTSPPYELVKLGPGSVPEIYAGPTSGYRQPLVSSFSDGTPMPFGAIDPALSADGKFVAFWSWGTDGAPEVYVKNLTTGELKIASSDALGNPGVDNASGTFNAGFNSIAISADGRYVAFTSDAILTPDDSGKGADLYVKDMQTGAIERVPLAAGTFADDLDNQLAMRADGQYVAFVTSAGLSAMDANHVADVYGVSLASLGTPPQIAINAVAGDDRINAAEDSNHVMVSGTSDAIGQMVTLFVEGGALPGVVVGTDGAWSTTVDFAGLTDGVYALRATVSNAAGSTGSDGDLVTVDSTAPTVKLSTNRTHLAAGQTATITATFSEGIGNIGAGFLTATGGVLSQQQFINDHTYTAIFTPNAGADTFAVQAHPNTAFDFAGNGNTATNLTAGLTFDGYIVGGTVSYANGSANGATATTDADGAFSLSGGNGPLVMTGGIDSATGLAFTGTFQAPDGATVLSPLTTLVEKVIEANPTEPVTQANNAVASALGLPAGIDLTTLDAFAGALSGDPDATAAFKAGSELLDAVTLVQAAGGSAAGVYAALVAGVAAGTPIDLTDAATLTAIGQSAGLDAAAAQAVASIAAQTDAALEQQLAHAASPFEIVTDITGAGIAEQGDAATALSHASGDAAYQQLAADYIPNLGHDDLTAADNIACYCPGTQIATDRGDVAVEDLRISDGVVVRSGAVRPIKWIGKRSYGGRFALGQQHILPVCFRSGSLGEGLPRRDLWISPHHAMYLEGVLIEARDLVNGVSIVQAERVENVDYFHIELETHDLIIAEGAWSETFVDDDSRGMFHNAHEYGVLYPDADHVEARYCAKRCADGYEVEAARRHIEIRAGLRPAEAETTAMLHGYVDLVSTTRIAGWAQNPAHPEAPVCLDIIADGRLIGQALANRYRDDLASAGIGSGRHAFQFTLPPGLAVARSAIAVRRSIDGVVLAFSSTAEATLTIYAAQYAA